jgi:hypothetical protein
MTTNPQRHKLRLRHNVPGTVYVLHFEPAYKHTPATTSAGPRATSASDGRCICMTVARR